MRVEDTELDLVEINQFNPNLDEYAERALLGPQADILQSIENVNARYNLKLKCTKTFRWSPGAFEQIKKAYMKYILDWEKRYSGIYQFFNRIDNKTWHHRSMKESLNRINVQMTDMRVQGLTFQDNSEIVKQTFIDIKDKIADQLESLNELYSDQDLNFNIYIDDNDLNTNYVVDVLFSNPNMSVANGGEKLIDIKAYPVCIRFLMPVFEHLNKKCGRGNTRYGRLEVKGKYLAPSNTLLFPYIQRAHNSNSEWHYVCLGDMISNISQSIWDFDLIAAATLLNQWISRYDIQWTHPHNRPDRLYYGLPKYIKEQENSQAYINAVSHTTDICGVIIAIEQLSPNKREYAIENDNTCNDVECEFRNKCGYYMNVVNASEDRIGEILKIKEAEGDTVQEDVYNTLFYYRDTNDSEEHVNKILCNENEVQLDELINQDITDEERTMRWVERQTLEFVNNTERRNNE